MGGNNALTTAATWQWQDAQRVIDYWCETMATKVTQLRTTGALASN
jgi:hypothetical protein